MINGEKPTDSNIIANKFCKYFTDVGSKPRKKHKNAQNINVD